MTLLYKQHMGERNEGTVMKFENVLSFVLLSLKCIERILKLLHHPSNQILLHEHFKEQVLYVMSDFSLKALVSVLL